MCIAIYKPANKTITKASLHQCFKSNPDGAGFMYVENKELKMQKGFFTFQEFWEAYEPHQEKQAAIHFRIKTHGLIDTDNCHPFMINSGLGFIHNGVISGFGLGNQSDTNHFNETIFKPLVRKYGNSIVTNPAIKTLVESKIGYSKFVVLDRHGNFELFNETKGIWDDEVWYSNSSYKPAPVQPMLPFKQPYITPKAKSRTPTEGDIVELITPIWDPATKILHKKGDIFEIVSVNSDYTVDLMSEDNLDGNVDAAFLYNVSYVKFDFLEDDLPSDHWQPIDNVWDFYVGV